MGEGREIGRGKMSKYVVTGGAGFIGANLARRLLQLGEALVVVDDLSRNGAAANLQWLQGQGKFDFLRLDLRDGAAVERLFIDHGDVDVVVHLAGQTAVTSSVSDPRFDFDANALGSFNVLEGVRKAGITPLAIYASTNKVYGRLTQYEVEESESRYRYVDLPNGVSESAQLDFHSPYGCSKGAADLYFQDYARIYGVPTVVFRQSCIYGPRQFGIEDQGWVAWLMIAALLGRPIFIFGDGKQVRDLLYVDDLIDVYLVAAEKKAAVSGNTYNIGGGPERSLSIWAEFGPILEGLLDRPVPVRFQDQRPGDQFVFISDTAKFSKDTGWRPKYSLEDGIQNLFDWIASNIDLFK